MKSLGNIQLGRQVVSQASLNNLHIKVASLTELNAYPNQSVAVFTANDGSFHTGDIVYNQNGTWVLLQKALTPTGKVRLLRGWKIDNQVFLRWHDPADVYDIDGNCIANWDHTVIVRKYGSAPVSVKDGTVVCTNTIRDRFHKSGSKPFINIVPMVDGEQDWYYRAFAYTKSGCEVSCDALKITEMPWDNIVEEIRNGNASNFFAPGDVIELPDGNEIVVASIDTCTASRPTVNPHLVTFIFRYSTAPMSFDYGKGKYVLTKDVYVQSGKLYYIVDSYDDDGEPESWVRARLTVGSLIKLNTYYESVYPEARQTSGSNRWQGSDVRAWANMLGEDGLTVPIQKYLVSTRAAQSIEENDANRLKPLSPMMYLTGLAYNADGTINKKNHWVKDLADHIVATNCVSARSKIDGNTYDTTSDYFFIPSVTEVLGERNGNFIEGTQFQIYSANLEGMTTEAFLDESTGIFARTGWWLRSAHQYASTGIDSGTDVEILNVSGVHEYTTAKSENGVVLAFSIG